MSEKQQNKWHLESWLKFVIKKLNIRWMLNFVQASTLGCHSGGPGLRFPPRHGLSSSLLSFSYCLQDFIKSWEQKTAVLIYSTNLEQHQPPLQGWPHFLCNGQKKCPQGLGGHKNMSKKAWRAKFNLKKSYIMAS